MRRIHHRNTQPLCSDGHRRGPRDAFFRVDDGALVPMIRLNKVDLPTLGRSADGDQRAAYDSGHYACPRCPLFDARTCSPVPNSGHDHACDQERVHQAESRQPPRSLEPS